jgi:hypothetical protein
MRCQNGSLGHCHQQRPREQLCNRSSDQRARDPLRRSVSMPSLVASRSMNGSFRQRNSAAIAAVKAKQTAKYSALRYMNRRSIGETLFKMPWRVDCKPSGHGVSINDQRRDGEVPEEPNHFCSDLFFSVVNVSALRVPASAPRRFRNIVADAAVSKASAFSSSI